MQRGFVLGVVLAGLVLVLVVPLLAGAGESSSFPAFVACRIQSGAGVCERYVGGGAPNGKVVYELHGDMRSGRLHLFSPYTIFYSSEAPPPDPRLVCAPPSESAVRCLVVSNANRPVIQDTRNALGFYVIVQPQP